MNVEHMSRKVFKAIFFSVKIGFVAFAMFVGCTGLRLTNMTAPVVQDPKEDMKFYCEYDMGGEELYAVKWYKDDHEFFRYIPAGNPNSVEFQVKGVHVDSRRTHCEDSSCTLYLNNLSRTFSSGAYRCEVSSEAPAFRLASQTHNVSIAVLPKQNPHIEGLSENYLIGDFLNISCISGLGDPKPTVSWYINKNPKEIIGFSGSQNHLSNIFITLRFGPFLGVYIGQTSQHLQNRQNGHKYDHKNTALRKHEQALNHRFHFTGTKILKSEYNKRKREYHEMMYIKKPRCH